MDVSKLRRVVIFIGLAVVVSALSGCGLIYRIGGIFARTAKVDAQYAELEGRKVAVVCEMAATSFGSYSPADEIAKLIAYDLGVRVDDIEIIPHEKVMDWKDRNDWNAVDFRDIGRGVNADMVVAATITNYRIYNSSFFQGRADVELKVYDMRRPQVPDFHEEFYDFTYPSKGGIPSTEMRENKFRRIFIRALARHISKTFYEYDLSEDLATDRTYIGR